MKVRTLVLMVVLLSLLLAACGGGNGDDPASPVKDFFSALAKQDVDKAVDTVCQAHQDRLRAGMEELVVVMGILGDDSKIEFDGLAFEIEDEKDDEAYVVVTGGTMKIKMGDDEREEPLVGEDTGLSQFKVIKEDGDWVICDEGFIEEMGADE